jgi:hypothetical protein
MKTCQIGTAEASKKTLITGIGGSHFHFQTSLFSNMGRVILEVWPKSVKEVLTLIDQSFSTISSKQS